MSISWHDLFAEEMRREGKAEGKIETLREVLLRVGCKRFGEADAAILQLLPTITDIDRLIRMCDAILEAQSWSELVNVA
jgi:hypothetical protein